MNYKQYKDYMKRKGIMEHFTSIIKRNKSYDLCIFQNIAELKKIKNISYNLFCFHSYKTQLKLGGILLCKTNSFPY